MATDPYDVVKSEIQTGLQSASSLLSSFKRIRSTASDDNEELQYAKSEVSFLYSSLGLTDSRPLSRLVEGNFDDA